MIEVKTDLRKLEQAATPGPWRLDEYGRAQGPDGAIYQDPVLSVDADLIAATRNALPYLLNVEEAARARELAEERLADFHSPGIDANSGGDHRVWLRQCEHLESDRAQSIHALRAALAVLDAHLRGAQR